MKKLVLLFCLLASPSVAATDVWFLYGWGPPAWSSGVDQMARRARTLSGVGTVHGPYSYYETQRVYDEINAAPAEHHIVISGYSCGANAATVIGTALHRHHYIAGIQPSLWCGSYSTTSSTLAAQDTYNSNCLQTLGFGCAAYHGGAQKILLIDRPDLHPQADNDPNAQRDVLGLIYAVANPSRSHLHINRLGRTTHFIRYNGQSVWLRE